ncbi:MAG TPA: methyltransferase domain-containing protein [Nitrobacter sp.]|nr:methyltransferase domain-containing protein [Nitrobacter sp.]
MPPISRPDFKQLIHGRVLEIGPFYTPFLSGPGVEYFDVKDQEKLREMAVQLDLDPSGCPPIHHVSPDGDLAIVQGQFDAVFSSHAIEHQPDLIGHLNRVADLLRPGGRYFAIVPDKRYCFDHFRECSTLEDVIGQEGKRLSDPRAISASHHRAHNDPVRHWAWRHGPVLSDHEGERHALERLDAGEYVDTHNWTFTPATFRQIAEALYETGKTKLKPLVVHDTAFRSCEFMAVFAIEVSP